MSPRPRAMHPKRARTTPLVILIHGHKGRAVQLAASQGANPFAFQRRNKRPLARRSPARVNVPRVLAHILVHVLGPTCTQGRTPRPSAKPSAKPSARPKAARQGRQQGRRQPTPKDTPAPAHVPRVQDGRGLPRRMAIRVKRLARHLWGNEVKKRLRWVYCYTKRRSSLCP